MEELKKIELSEDALFLIAWCLERNLEEFEDYECQNCGDDVYTEYIGKIKTLLNYLNSL